MTREQRFVTVFHAAFAGLAVLALALPLGALGVRVLALVVLYNIALPTLASWQHTQVLELWTFLLPLSLLMVLPDWFLSDVLRILVFPQTGSPFIGTVPLFMAGMWIIPLFLILYPSLQIETQRGRGAALISAAALALLLFAGAEATLWAVPIWYAREVTQVAHIALYVLLPESVLGASTYLAFVSTRNSPLAIRLAAGWGVMALYLGNLCLSYLLLE